MLVRELKQRPPDWAGHKAGVRTRWLAPLHAVEWVCDWIAYGLSRWAFLEVLEYLGVLSVLIAVVFYFTESGDRMKQKHYQAWQVINTAQGKGGSGGRIEALQELNSDREPLVGVDASGSFLQGVRLPRANLLRANLSGADLRDSSFEGSNLAYSTLQSANFRNANLREASLTAANFEDADLAHADLSGADLSRANLKNADLSHADLKDVRWREIQAIDKANIYGVRNAPEGFVDWALQLYAVQVKGEAE